MSPTEATLNRSGQPAILRDGGSVIVRAVRPDDRPRLRELFAHMGPNAIRHRFFGAKREVTEAEIDRVLTADPERPAALVATVCEADTEHIVGLGEIYPLEAREADRTRAEVAFAVADEHQGRGIGTLLLEHLAATARGRGISELDAVALADNRQMLEVFSASGFAVEELRDRELCRVSFPTRATDSFLRASLERERAASAESVRVFFEPRSVAVIGASRKPGSIGRAILANLVRCGFAGPIHPINPNATEIEGLRCAPSVSSLGAECVDLAIIAVPAPAVRDAIADCAAAGVRGVVVISAGFAEATSDGRRAQDELRALVRGAGMRMVGPNCMGVLNADPSVALNATFAPTWPPAGNVSMASQSGALGLAMLDHAAALNLGIAGFVSVGNKADVSGNDLLSYWENDPHTGVIALYLESFGNPRKFARIAPEIARKKPIVAVKSGRSAAGSRAAASHSAALASLDVGVDALLSQAGVIRTTTLEEMFDVISLLSNQPIPRGSRVGVVTNAGGPGILLADACEAHGLSLPALTEATLAKLRSFLPAHAGLSNPVDMIASAPPEHYATAIEAVGKDPNIDSVVAIYIPPLVTEPEQVAQAIATAAGTLPDHIPIATVFMSSKGAPPVLSGGPRRKIPSYSFPENAALALASAVRYGAWRSRTKGESLALDQNSVREIRRIIDAARAKSSAPQWLSPGDLDRILELAGIALAAQAEAPPSPAGAAEVAARLGFPLVAKAIAPGLVHKSDVGGVVLGLHSADAVAKAVATMTERLAAAGHTLEGVLLQRQIEGGVEAFVGVTTDPSLGPILVAGMGGVHVELLRDVAFRLPPVTDRDADDMLGELRSGRLLDGYRGTPRADRAALSRVIQKVSALVEVIPELSDFELNPVKVMADGKGVIAVDARMRLTGATKVESQ